MSPRTYGSNVWGPPYGSERGKNKEGLGASLGASDKGLFARVRRKRGILRSRTSAKRRSEKFGFRGLSEIHPASPHGNVQASPKYLRRIGGINVAEKHARKR